MCAKRILISGGTGLLGRNVIRLLEDSWEVYAIVRLLPDEKAKNVNYIVQDLTQGVSVECLPTEIDAVMHLAQWPSYRSFDQDAVQIFEVNTAAALKLVDYASKSGARKFILASSGGLYAPSSNLLTEDAALGGDVNSLNYYFSSKRCAEMLVDAYRSLIDITIVRPFFIYGPGQRKEMLFPRLIESVRAEQPITIQGEDGIKINPIFVEDAAEIFIKILNSGCKIGLVNVSGSEVLSVRQIARKIGDIVGVHPSFVSEGDAPLDFVADTSLMEACFAPARTNLDIGLEKMFKQLGSR